MSLHRLPLITSTCLVLALAACTDDTQDDAADEVGTESTSDESGSTESESGSSSEESGSTETGESESESTSDATETETTETETTATETDTSDATETDTSEESTSEESTSEESTTTDTDTGFESCEDVEATYEALVSNNTSCVLDEQCHVVDGHCWMGLGGCWYVVNENVQQADLEELADAYTGLACFGPICACLPPPDAVGCVDGTCLPL